MADPQRRMGGLFEPDVVIARRYRHAFRQRGFTLSLVRAAVLFAASVVISFYAITYATEKASSSVTDLFLSNVPYVNVDGLFVYGTIALIGFIALVLLLDPKRMPFTLSSMGLFFLIRSGFTSLTHIGPFPLEIQTTFDPRSFLSHFLFSSDLFFSGHVGVSFLMALIFWRNKFLRFVFLAATLFLGAVVLLGHLHYSIDVASAFFITFTIYCIAEKFFPGDRAFFYSE